MKAIILIFLIIFTCHIYGHGGGVKKSGEFIGCHNNRKSGEFHCHKNSKYNGMSWASESEAISNLGGRKQENRSLRSGYNRKDWKHWIDEDHDCENTRMEILKERSLKPVKMNKSGCRVLAGEWNDYYFPEVLTNTSKIDIDHLVPLKHAHDYGGASWSNVKKKQFANDPENLVITNLKYNRQKGPKSILEWMPINRAYACKYLTQWLKIKSKYELIISDKEQEFYKLAKCD
jgi:hypothetical protein